MYRTHQAKQPVLNQNLGQAILEAMKRVCGICGQPKADCQNDYKRAKLVCGECRNWLNKGKR